MTCLPSSSKCHSSIGLAASEMVSINEITHDDVTTLLDVVFFIYLYQRWIYPTDPHRLNEFGTSANDQQLPPEGITSEGTMTSEGGVAPGDSGNTVEPAASFSGEESDVSLDGNSSNETVELRRRLHRRED